MDFTKYIQPYKAAYKHHWGKDISEKDALDGVIQLFNFAKAVSEPIPDKDLSTQRIKLNTEKKKPPWLGGLEELVYLNYNLIINIFFEFFNI